MLQCDFQWVRKAGRLLREQDPYLELLWDQLNEPESLLFDAMRWQWQEAFDAPA